MNIPFLIGGAKNILARVFDVLIKSVKTPRQRRNAQTSYRQKRQTVIVQVSIRRNPIVNGTRANVSAAGCHNIAIGNAGIINA
jgi:hypothetical protein